MAPGGFAATSATRDGDMRLVMTQMGGDSFEHRSLEPQRHARQPEGKDQRGTGIVGADVVRDVSKTMVDSRGFSWTAANEQERCNRL